MPGTDWILYVESRKKKKQAHRYREYISGCQKWGVRGEGLDGQSWSKDTNFWL